MVKIKRVLLSGTFILLLGCSALLILILAHGSTPSRKELCGSLATYISISACLNQETTMEVLSRTFETGVTTQDEVYEALGQWRAYACYYSFGWYKETYTLDSFLGWGTFYQFHYNESGILESIELAETVF